MNPFTCRDNLDTLRHDRTFLEAELKLAGVSCDIRRDTCRCPFHDDHHASGSIFRAPDGGWRYKCHAPACGASGDVFDLRARIQGRPLGDVLRDARGGGMSAQRDSPQRNTGRRTWGSAVAAITHMKQDRSLVGYALAATYPYGEDAADPAGFVLRFEHPDGSKTFRQVCRLPNGHWAAEGMPAPRPLFRLPGLRQGIAAGKPVVIAEGEKAVLALEEAGFIATTNAGGAGAAAKSDWTPLRGAKVVVWRDADESGVAHAAEVMRQLGALRPPPMVHHIWVDDLPSKADAADLPTDEVRRRVAEALSGPGCALPEEIKPEGTRSAVMVRLSDVAPERITWLWKGKLAMGKVHLLAGDPGLGKSTVALDIAARITRGTPFPFETGEGRPPGGVVVLAAEDGLADTVRPRMDAAGADVSRVVALQAIKLWGKDGKARQTGLTLADLEAIDQATTQAEGCTLVMIDPLMAYLGDKDSHKDAEVRSLLAPLAQWAERRRVAVLIVAHLNKGDGRKAAYRVGGSVGIIASARVALGVAKDKEDPTLRLIAPIKNNIGKDTGGLSYRLVQAEGSEHPRVEWVSVKEGMDGDTLLAGSDEEEGGQALDDALEGLLGAHRTEGVPFAHLQAVGQDVGGYGEKAVRAALRRLGAINRRQGFQGATHWHLPPANFQGLGTSQKPGNGV